VLLKVFGPFLAYEILALVVLRYRRGRGKSMPTAARFANAVIETSLPTVILWWMNQFTSPLVAFGAWPTLLYFVFIVASTLRLDFVLPAFTWRVFIPSRARGVACDNPFQAPVEDFCDFWRPTVTLDEPKQVLVRWNAPSVVLSKAGPIRLARNRAVHSAASEDRQSGSDRCRSIAPGEPGPVGLASPFEVGRPSPGSSASAAARRTPGRPACSPLP
jgi:hypothetical protein